MERVIRVGQEAEDVVERRKSHASVAVQQRVIFCVRVGGGDDPVECCGAKEARYVIVGVERGLTQQCDDVGYPRSSLVLVLAARRNCASLAAVLLVNSCVDTAAFETVEALDDDRNLRRKPAHS